MISRACHWLHFPAFAIDSMTSRAYHWLHVFPLFPLVEHFFFLLKPFFSSLVIRESPIFFRPHSKAILSRAIHNDTEFLAQQMVMDYSLLVGIDEARSELVTGIIGEAFNPYSCLSPSTAMVVHNKTEGFENGVFTLKTYQMFSAHATPEEFENACWICV